ncbi:uncharacterized protein LOC115028624 [Cottoperca gobio]|uniref:Uncharacterized protein LOC115028624 n=1 Tax=Cottoperca gobio TaxID=56716 RepID=A0A6J2S9K6_COTGO|nr:uncharacterized protein LOC115028624 [Cottoperca gobio]
MKDIEVMFEAYGIRLPLLKALIDRLLQDGIEDLLRVLGTSQKTTKNTESHTSNVIAEYTSSVKFDLTSQPLKEDTIEDSDIDGHLPGSLTFDPLNKTEGGPTLWTVTTLNGEQELDRTENKLKRRGKEIVDVDVANVSSLKMNLTLINSTFNSTTTQETVSGLPETVAETVLPTQEDSLKKNSGHKKKKNRERGKTSDEDEREEDEEEFYNSEEYSYEYEDELSPNYHLASQERKGHRQEEQLPTHSPAQLQTLPGTSSHPLTSSADGHIDAQVFLTTTEPQSQSLSDIEKDAASLPTPPITTEEPDKVPRSQIRVKKSAPWPDSMVFMPGAPGGRNRFKEAQKHSSSGAQGYNSWNVSLRSKKTLTFKHIPGGRGKNGGRGSDTVIQKNKLEERNKLKKWKSGK